MKAILVSLVIVGVSSAVFAEPDEEDKLAELSKEFAILQGQAQCRNEAYLNCFQTSSQLCKRQLEKFQIVCLDEAQKEVGDKLFAENPIEIVNPYVACIAKKHVQSFGNTLDSSMAKCVNNLSK